MTRIFLVLYALLSLGLATSAQTLTKSEARKIIANWTKENPKTDLFWSAGFIIENESLVVETNLTTNEIPSALICKDLLTYQIAKARQKQPGHFNIICASKYNLVCRYLENGQRTREITFTPQELSDIAQKSINRLNINKNAIRTYLAKSEEWQTNISLIDNITYLKCYTSIDSNYIVYHLHTSSSYWNTIDEDAALIRLLLGRKKQPSLFYDIRAFCGIIGEKVIYISPTGNEKTIKLTYSDGRNFSPTAKQKRLIKDYMIEEINTTLRSAIDVDYDYVSWAEIKDEFICITYGYYPTGTEIDIEEAKNDYLSGFTETPFSTTQELSIWKSINISGVKLRYIDVSYNMICEITVTVNDIQNALKAKQQ